MTRSVSHRRSSVTEPLLQEPDPSLIHVLPVGEPLGVAAEVPATRGDCLGIDEPIEELNGFAVLDAYATLGILPVRKLRLRRSVVDRLREAERGLPRGFALVVLDAWRSIAEQTRLVDYYQRTGPVDGFVARVDGSQMRPPHTTGGAVDLTLSWRTLPLALGTDFDNFSDEASLTAFESTDGVVRRLRRVLTRVMASNDFTPYPKEWWHWSYGDDVWAAAKGVPALFDSVETILD